MFRTLTTIALATLLSSSVWAQTTSDPVEQLTRDVIGRFLPASATGSYRSLKADLPTDAARENAAQDAELRERPNLEALPLEEDAEVLEPLPMPRMYPRLMPLPMIPSRPRLFLPQVEPGMPSPFLATPHFAGKSAEGADIPQPLSLSAASANGIHAIQAVVETEEGPERVELKGTRDQLKDQVKTLSPQARRVMTHSLGL